MTTAVNNVRRQEQLKEAADVFDRLMKSRKVRRNIKKGRLETEEVPVRTEGKLPRGIRLRPEHPWGYDYWWTSEGLVEKHGATEYYARLVEPENVFPADLGWVTACLRDLL